MKTSSLLLVLLFCSLMISCKKDDPPAAPGPVRITSPCNGWSVSDTVPVLFSISSSLHVTGVEFFVDYQLAKAWDSVPPEIFFYANRYAKGSPHSISLQVTTAEGKSYSSNIVSLTISMLTQPKVSVNSDSKNEVVLTWSMNSYSRSGYKVFRQSGNQNYSVIAELGPDAWTFTDTALDTLQTYTYRVEVFSATDRVSSDPVAVAYFLNRYKRFTDYTMPGSLDGQIAISPDGRKIVVTNYMENSFTVIDTQTGQLTSLPQTGGSHGLAMSHSGNFFVTGGTHDLDLIKVWDLNSLTLIRQFNSESANYSLTLNQADNKLVVGGEPVRIYDITSGSLLQTYPEQHAYGRSTAYSHDETRLLTGGNDGLVKIYNTSTGNLDQIFTGHTKQVGTAIYTSDESKVISGSYEEPTVRVWDVINLAALQVITMAQPTVTLRNAKNGDIVIGSLDGLITILDKDFNVVQTMHDFYNLHYIDYNGQLDMIAGTGSSISSGSKVILFKKFGHWEPL